MVVMNKVGRQSKDWRETRIDQHRADDHVRFFYAKAIEPPCVTGGTVIKPCNYNVSESWHEICFLRGVK